jgi:hypothetical protein
VLRRRQVASLDRHQPPLPLERRPRLAACLVPLRQLVALVLRQRQVASLVPLRQLAALVLPLRQLAALVLHLLQVVSLARRHPPQPLVGALEHHRLLRGVCLGRILLHQLPLVLPQRVALALEGRPSHLPDFSGRRLRLRLVEVPWERMVLRHRLLPMVDMVRHLLVPLEHPGGKSRHSNP